MKLITASSVTLSCLCFFTSVTRISAQSCPYDASQRLVKSFGTKTTYEQARVELGNVKEWTPKDKYTPIFAYGFIRHGIRYPDREDIEDILKFIKENQYTKEFDNEQCPKSSWPLLKMKPDDDNHLSESGGKEVAEIAERFAKRLPDLFARPELIEIGISEKIRTSETAKHFFDGLIKATGSNAQFKPEASRVSSYHDVCRGHAGGKLDAPAKKEAQKQFESRDDVKAMVERVKSKLPNIAIGMKEVKLLNKACSFSLALYNEWAPACSMFTAEDNELLDLQADIDDYYGDAYGASAAQTSMPCAVTTEFFEKLNEMEVEVDDKKINISKPVVLRFSHAGAVKPLIAHLGIEEDKAKNMNPLTLSPTASRKWHSSQLSPFASNIWFVVLVKDKKVKKFVKKARKGKDAELDEDDLYVATLVQERLVELDKCDGDDGLCKMKDFRKRVIKAMGKNGCDLQTICKNAGAAPAA